LLFRNPTVFDAAAAWDFPADQSDTIPWGMLDNYGTEANFQNEYRLAADWIAARKGPFQAEKRLWLSEDYVTYYGIPTFRDEVLAFAGRLYDNNVPFMMEGGATRAHSWTSGWLPEAVAGLGSRQDIVARDDFNRADGDLGANWAKDPLWGAGLLISGNKVSSPMSSGGTSYWNGKVIGADQYSQIKITGEIGVWTGVFVRGKVSPSQGYVVAIKPDGAYLYALLNNQFYQLVYDATGWSMGDALRLEVRTVASNTARLAVYRNGNQLFTYDDAASFIGSGQPGIGLYASSAVSLDDWEGGSLNRVQQPPTSSYTITASAGSYGTIAPTGLVSVPSGTSKSFSITASTGYTVQDVTVDGASVGAVTSYTFTNVTANHTIAASFAAASYTLTVTKSGTGSGTVTTNPSGTSFSAGTPVTLTATPDASSTFTRWSGGCSGTAPTCTLTMNGNTSVTATFTLKSYSITASAGWHGTISPTGLVSVPSGTSKSFSIKASTGYKIQAVTVDGASVGAVTSYTFTNVTANHTIAASFAR
jgi:hypothetical protein